MRDYTALLKKQNEAQLQKLIARDYHGDFPKDPHEIAEKMKVEVWELIEELQKDQIDWNAVRLEFADIANYAGMGISAANRKADIEDYITRR